MTQNDESDEKPLLEKTERVEYGSSTLTSSNEPTTLNEKTPPSISLFTLFRYADLWDRVLIFFGTLAAIGDGILIPLLAIFFGQLAGSFTIYGRYKQCNLDYYTCFNNNLTTFNRSVWNFVIQPELDDFESNGYEAVKYILAVAAIGFVVGLIHTFAYTQLSLNDILTIKDGIGTNLSLAIQQLVRGISGMTIALIYSWQLGLVGLSLTPLIVLSQLSLMKVSSASVKKEQKAYAKAGSIAEEALSSIKTVTAFGGQKKEILRYSENLTSAKPVELKRGFWQGIFLGIIYCTMMAIYSLVFWYGANLIVDTDIPIANVMTTFTGVMLSSSAVGRASSFFDFTIDAKAAGSKVFQSIDRKPDIDIFSEDGVDPNPKSGDIVFENVSFVYPTRPDATALNKTSFTVKSGQSVAIIGESGAGKSTIIQLIQRFYNISAGMITVGGQDIRELHLRKYRDTIGVVSQEPVLFATTIAENIRWGRDGITDEEMIDAAKQANAYDFIMSFPKQFNTLVGEGGGQLSGGQKQRIAIARAIARNPKILLLDEATSALDRESESLVQAALEKAASGRTTIIIAHRLSTIRGADNIIAMRGGQVVEVGSHDELMKNKDGVYFSLTNAQAKVDHIEEHETDLVVPKTRHTSDISHKTSERYRTKSELYIDDEEVLPEFSFLRVLAMNKSEWPYIAGGCVLSCITGSILPLAGLLSALFLGVFALATPTEQLQQALFQSRIFAGAALVSLLGYLIQCVVFAKSGVELTIRLRKKVFRAVLRQDMTYFDDPRNSTGAISARLSRDASLVKGATGTRLGLALANVSTFVVAVGIALGYSWKLTLANLAFVPFEFLFQKIFKHYLLKAERDAQESHETAGEIASEAIYNIRTIASLTKEEKTYQRYEKELHRKDKSEFRKVVIQSFIYAFHRCTMLIGYAVTYALGIHLVKKGAVYFQSVFIVVFTLLNGATALIQNSVLIPNYEEAKQSTRRMFAILSKIPLIDPYSDEGISPDSCKGAISFKDVNFSYPTRPDYPVLKNVDIVVKPGQTLALVGQSGSGKSTTVELIERFYDPQNGMITLDDVEIKELNVAWLREQIGLVSQEPDLFDQTIEENIRYGEGSNKARRSDVLEAARNANIADFVATLPEGYNTIVGGKGGKLSGGQKQRIAIARALVRNPKILLLDEATSALDTESEKVVQNALDVARRGRTSIVIAHNLSTIINADQIAVIDNGTVVEIGTHDELVELKGVYFNLAKGRKFAPRDSSATI